MYRDSPERPSHLAEKVQSLPTASYLWRAHWKSSLLTSVKTAETSLILLNWISCSIGYLTREFESEILPRQCCACSLGNASRFSETGLPSISSLPPHQLIQAGWLTKRLLQNVFVYKEIGGTALRSDYTVTVLMKLQKVNFPMTLWFIYWNNMKRESQSWLLAVTWHQ